MRVIVNGDGPPVEDRGVSRDNVAMPADPEMTLADVVGLLDLCARNDIGVWLDGGWAVDALLGNQTRRHSDIDIVVEEKDLATLRRLLEAEGYRDVPRDDTRAENFVLGDDRGHEVDFHVIVLDEAGNGIYGPPGGHVYPAAALAGAGVVGGRAVRCITPEYLVKFHTGYKIRERDIHDVSALCARFGIPYPAEYRI